MSFILESADKFEFTAGHWPKGTPLVTYAKDWANVRENKVGQGIQYHFN